MDLKLENRVIVVSGGAKGIGESISRELAKEGCKVVIAGRSQAAGEKLVEEMRSQGSQIANIVADLSDPGASEMVIRESIEHFGTIHGIVNNAGVNDGVGLENGSPEAFRKSVNTNLLHYYELVYFALPYLKQNKGAIVNISSKTALTGQGGTSGYVHLDRATT